MAANGTREDAFPGPREDPSERTFLGRSSLGARYGWLIVFALIAAAVAGGALYIADQRAQQALDELAEAGDVSRRIAAIENGSQALHAASQAYLTTRDERIADDYRARNESLNATLRALIDDPAAIDGQKLATTLNEGLTQHAEHFQNIVRITSLLGAASSGLVGNAKATGDALQTRLAEAGASALAERLAALRRIEGAIVSGAGTPGERTLADEVAEFRRAVSNSPQAAETRAEIDRLAEAYATDITQLARVRAALSGSIARLNEVGEYMAPNLAALVSFAGELGTTARTGAARTQEELRYIVGGGVGGAIVFLLLTAMVLIGSLTRPIGRLARAAGELAHGNQSVAIPVLGNDDETGTVARALTYFRENLIQADRLRKELEVQLQRTAPMTETPALPPPAELEPSRALVPASPEAQAGTQISNISRRLAESSRAASAAAGDAERTENMVNGLSDAAERVSEIESLLASISDQMSLLSVQTALAEDSGNERENLVVLAEKRHGEAVHRGGQSVGDRIDAIQSGTKRAIKAVQQIGRAIAEVNDIAVQFAADTSSEALDAATELLHQSEDLRGMLDELLTKIRTEGGSAPPPARGRSGERDV